MNRLEPDECHVYWQSFAAQRDDSALGLATLSDEERQRAARLALDADRLKFVHAHAFKRRILARYLGVDARDIPIVRLWTGKPTLAAPTANGVNLGFSLAHSTSYAVVAIARTTLVGVDVEEPRASLDVAGLARRYFAAEEADALTSLSAASAQGSFLRSWTSKEAFVKATGLGLSYPLSGVVASRDHKRPEYTAIRGEYGPPAAWTLRLYRPERSCYIAVALKVAPARITLMAFRPSS